MSPNNLTWQVFVVVNAAGLLGLAYWVGRNAQKIEDLLRRISVIEAKCDQRQEESQVPYLTARISGIEERLKELITEIAELRKVLLAVNPRLLALLTRSLDNEEA